MLPYLFLPMSLKEVRVEVAEGRGTKFRGEGEVKSEVLISENGTGEKHHLFLLKTLQVFIFLSYFLECIMVIILTFATDRNIHIQNKR